MSNSGFVNMRIGMVAEQNSRQARKEKPRLMSTGQQRVSGWNCTGYRKHYKRNHIIDTHHVVELKPEKENNKVSIKALEKFNALLDEQNY